MVHDSNRARGLPKLSWVGQSEIAVLLSLYPNMALKMKDSRIAIDGKSRTANHLGLVVLTDANASHSIAKKSHVHCKSPRKRSPKIVVLMDWFHQPLLLLVGMVLLCCIQVASVLQEVPAEYVPFPWLPHWYSMCSSFKSSEDTHTDMRRFKTHGNVYAVSKDTGWSLGL